MGNNCLVFHAGGTSIAAQTPMLILHAEDDATDAFFFHKALSMAKMKNPLVHVLDGDLALQYLMGTGCYSDRDKYPFPSLLVTDLKMPGMSGFDLLAAITAKLQSKELRAVVLTGSVDDLDKKKCLQLGAGAYFVKPVDLQGWAALTTELKQSWLPETQDQPV